MADCEQKGIIVCGRRQRHCKVWSFRLALLIVTMWSNPIFSQEGEGPLALGTITSSAMVRECSSTQEQLSPDRVVLQVIDDTFHKWREYELGGGEFCIIMDEPRFQVLTEQHARTLLESSTQWMKIEPKTEQVEVLDPDDPALNVPPAMPPRPYDPARSEVGNEGPDTPAETFYAVADAPGNAPGNAPGLAASGAHSPQVVIGTDDRVRITSTTNFPWRTVAFQRHTYPDNSAFRCTAFLITPHVAMTNGHCIYDDDQGGYVNSFSIAPGQRQDSDGGVVTRPYGLWSADSWTTNQQYVNTGEAQYDYAISRYTASFSNVLPSTYMPLVFEISPPVGSTINLAGYPGTAHGAGSSALWHSADEVHSISGRVLHYLADTSTGNSGGPVWEFFAPDTRRIVAVHSFGCTACGFNGGPRLVSQNQSVIEGWMAYGLPSRGLSVTKFGGGTGTVSSMISPGGISCGATCSASFANNSLVTLTQSAATGSNFAGWGGACFGTGACTVTMSAARSVTATFNLNLYTLSVNKAGTGSGTVSSSPSGINCGATCAASFNHGTSVVLTAASVPSSNFAGWSGGCNGTSTTCTVSMTQARTTTASFNLNLYTLAVGKDGTGSGNVTSSPGGINCGATCAASFSHGTSVVLTATSTPGSSFTGWSGGCSGTSSTCTVSMTQARTATARFNLNMYTLSVGKDGTGSGNVTSSPGGINCGATCAASFSHGTSVVLTATSTPGSSFTGWSGGCSGTSSTCTVSMTQARTATARFNLNMYTLSVGKAGSGNGVVRSNPGGINCGSTCSGSFQHGIAITLMAEAADGSRFVNWTEGGQEVSTDAYYGFTVSEGRDLMAHFEETVDDLYEDRFELE